MGVHMSLSLGIVGNCQYNALIDRAGNVVWMCWPKFDSSFVFGSLVDEQKGGRFSIGTVDQGEGQQTYIENTNVLVTRFETMSGVFEVVDFAPRFSQFGRFFKPKMLIRIVRPLTGNPLIRVLCVPRYEYGEKLLAAQTRSNHLLYEGGAQPLRLFTDASLYMIQEGRPFALAKPQYFVLTWGNVVDQSVQGLCETYYKNTVDYWQRWVKHCHLPREYQHQVIRSALVLKLHQFEDTGAIIAATTSSIPEAPGTGRNWDYRYCWLRDAQFTLQALRRLGQFEEMENFVAYLRNLIETSVDRLQPVYSITGASDLTERILTGLTGYLDNSPVRIGNQAYEHIQHDIYGEMIMAISPLFIDARFTVVAKPKPILMRLIKAIEVYLEKEDAGLWEFRGTAQIHTFSLLMHWAGAKHALEIAEECGYDDVYAIAEQLIGRSETILNERCWNPTLGAFAQAPGTHELDAALLQMINLGYLRKDDPRAFAHLTAIRRGLSVSDVLLRRYRHVDDFGATENAFTICSFWLAEAYARLGEREQGKQIFTTLLRAANHLGLYSEDLHPATFEQWGNFPQAYSHVGFINAAFALSDPWE